MKPTNKVIAGVLAGAVTTIAVWAARQFGAIEFPPEVQGAITVVFTFAAQWLTSDGSAA